MFILLILFKLSAIIWHKWLSNRSKKQLHKKVRANDGAALFLFPVEVWELILGNLEDSKDILNVYKAFPELDRMRVLKDKIHIWAFEQIMPHISGYLTKRETLNCREVCRKWCRGVEHFLENHPARRPYDPEVHLTGQHWISEGSSDYQNLESLRGWHWRTSTPGKLVKIINQVGAQVNPVVGRSMVVRHYDSSMDAKLVLRFFHQFGNYIRFLELDDYSPPKFILDSLLCLPNLKSLKLPLIRRKDYYNKGNSHTNLTSKDAMPPFKPLAYLESLEMLYDTDEELTSPSAQLANLLVTSHSAQLKRLLLPFWSWKPGYGNLFPKLIELELTCCGYTLTLPSKEDLIGLLSALNSPKLRKLNLPYLNKQDLVYLIPVLKRFPQLISVKFVLSLSFDKYSEFIVAPITSTNEPLPPIEVIDSVKSLCLSYDEEELDIQILQFFPALEYLRMDWSLSGRSRIKKEGHIYLYTSAVWEAAPKLKEITVNLQDPKMLRTTGLVYTRAIYEVFKKPNNNSFLQHPKLTRSRCKAIYSVDRYPEEYLIQ